jgi:hypothetical protein
MIKRFITWVKGLWSKDISDEERERIQNEMFLSRIKKNAFYERSEPNIGVDALLNASKIAVMPVDPTPEFKSPSKKLADEFDQITWGSLTDDAKRECISIARLDLAKQSSIIDKLHEAL